MERVLGEEISRRRRQSYLTRRELARDIGVTEATIFFWERGRSRPALRNIEKIEHRLGFKAGELLGLAYPAEGRSA